MRPSHFIKIKKYQNHVIYKIMLVVDSAFLDGWLFPLRFRKER